MMQNFYYFDVKTFFKIDERALDFNFNFNKRVYL